MLYLIGGAPRTGKSKLAQKIMRGKKVSYCSTDPLVHALKNAIPEYGVTDEISLQDRAEKFYPFFERYIFFTDYCIGDYVIEGDVILPQYVSKLQNTYDVKSVFLGNSKLTLEQVKNNVGNNDWILDRTDKEQREMIELSINSSEWLQNQCSTYNMNYIDMEGNFETKILEAMRKLLD